MLLNNFKTLFINDYQHSSNVNLKGIGGATVSVNTTGSQGIHALFGWSNNYITNSDVGRFDVGFDDTEVDADDYAFSGNFEQNLLTSISQSNNTKTVGEIWNFGRTFRNDSENNVTVREVAYVYNPTSSNSPANFCLLFRKVLDTPITIAPGETYNFTLTLKFKNS